MPRRRACASAHKAIDVKADYDLQLLTNEELDDLARILEHAALRRK
jgi:hypothetical protein